ncbi:hypothetical protein WJX73_004236 [Symbiochloris irregularis]|uniref:Uncharacterized protein n=1 Tax=Symbiochloris irregularis TaxID=706552 RepID=A0AAW1NNC2_9CHLO
MDTHSAVQALKNGCAQEGLPRTAAKELVRFLFVKRLIGDESGSRLSPSATLDTLWHWMLLETDVRDKVEALIGGKVKHTQATMHHTDEEKMQRRLDTLECFAREGWQPVLSLWEEHGSVLSELAPVTVAPEGIAGEEFVKYTCVGKGIDSVVDELTAQDYDITQAIKTRQTFLLQSVCPFLM